MRIVSETKLRGFADYVLQWVNGGQPDEYWIYEIPDEVVAEAQDRLERMGVALDEVTGPQR